MDSLPASSTKLGVPALPAIAGYVAEKIGLFRVTLEVTAYPGRHMKKGWTGNVQ
jgi:hypothetical protein